VYKILKIESVNTKKKLRELDVKISEFDIADADKYFL
jgi:hypothetical protein